MADKAKSKPGRNLGGRPTRGEALRRAIAAIGVDPSLVDPKRILAGIAIDEAAPATARVAACRILLAHSGTMLPALPVEVEDEVEDELSRRALQIHAAGRPN
jgi:hypothetical protein